MSDEINVIVVKRKGLNLYLRYIDPIDGKRREKNSGTTNMKAAQRAAGEWQAELNASGTASPGLMRWEQFREDFSENYLSHYSQGYITNFEGSLNIVEELMNPDTLGRITETWITRFYSLARKRLLANASTKRVAANATIRKYFQHLNTAMKWAKEQGYIKTVPAFPKQSRQTKKGGKLMKGRPITGEEFDRMIEASDNDSLNHLLRGLWLSGLRLGEALNLTWDQWADGIRVNVDSDGDVCLMIDGDNQKSGQALVYPLVDDFADFLKETPDDQRDGFVFNPQRVREISRRVDTVSNWIVEIGQRAGVKVDDKDGVEKFASAHDLRRAFGTRWAKVVPPGLLKELMRHANIETTMNFYVNITAKDTMAEVKRHQKKNGNQNSPEKVNGKVNE